MVSVSWTTGRRKDCYGETVCGRYSFFDSERLYERFKVERPAKTKAWPGDYNITPGEEVPVILMDSHKREDRKEAARRMDAAGYLVYPIDVARIAERLEKIVASPRRRRFTRYAQRLPVKLQGQQEPLLTNSISRGGMFVVTDGELDTHALQDCRLGLPEIGANLRVEAEVLYQAQAGRQGVGVCFHGFPDADEPVLIEYLRNLHPECPAPAI